MKEIHVYEMDSCEVWACKCTKEEAVKTYNDTYGFNGKDTLTVEEVTEFDHSKVTTVVYEGDLAFNGTVIELVNNIKDKFSAGNLHNYVSVGNKKDVGFLDNPIIIYYTDSI